MNRLLAAEWLSVASLSVDPLPESLARLIGQHPAALRSVCWAEAPAETGALAFLEIETKHGFVTLIDRRTGEIYAYPPVPPDADVRLPRWQQDLTESLPCAFAGRPKFAEIEAIRTPSGEHSEQIGWQFSFDTGAAFTLTAGDGIQIVSG